MRKTKEIVGLYFLLLVLRGFIYCVRIQSYILKYIIYTKMWIIIIICGYDAAKIKTGYTIE